MEPKEKNAKRIKTKLFYSTVALVVGIVVLFGAAFAWYTLSTNPEIKGINATVNGDRAIQISTDNKIYDLSMPLPELSNNAPLIPVSTVDGLNWFICKYDVTGDVLQVADPEKYLGTQFMYLRFPDGGNVNKNTGKVVKKKLGNVSEQVASYYIYTDVYLKTEMGETDVYLSLPSEFNSEKGYEQQETEKTHYGTYVLSYDYNEKTNTVRVLNNASNTAVRVGFMVLGEVEDGENKDKKPEESEVIKNPEYYFVSSNEKTEGADPGTKDVEPDKIKNSNKFIIFEPNADSRSYADKSSDEFDADLYIAGFQARKFKTAEGDGGLTYGQLDKYYLQTYPIKVTGITYDAIKDVLLTGNESTVIPQGKDKSEKTEKIENLKQTFYGPQDDEAEPKDFEGAWLIDGQDISVTRGEGESAVTETGKVDGTPSYFDLNNLSIQLTSTWKSAEAMKLEEGKSLKDLFNSTLVGTMGKFLIQKTATAPGGIDLLYKTSVSPTELNKDYTAVDVSNTKSTEYRGYSKITTLKKDVPQKVRIYFWIEGQDVDCWNDISFTDFLVNLELVGDVIKEEAETTAASN